MTSQNASIKVTEFIIGGFDLVKRPVAVGVVILIIYVVAVLANITNILFIINDQKLHKPMYLLICNLAVVDIMYISSASPTMIGVLVAGVKTISYVPCLIQMFAFQLGWVMEMFALAVMAFDRLLAISCPLQYHSYLTNARTLVLTYMLWMVGCGFVAVFPSTVIPLPYCYSVLKYAFCDYAAVLRTTCVDPEYYFNLVAVVMFLILFFTFIFICLSYVGIIFFAKLSSYYDKKKMGSTCLSHLIVVTCYYSPVFLLVILTRLGVVLTLEARNGLNIGSILGPSLVNPFVYCLRTKEIKSKIINTFKKVFTSQ
ncbi:Olfactory receptor 10G4 Olfactory receptor OR11-278 [Channa argus]|uniref:Olfactory receptor 10G4 Olfactory receptor OR11-278 n=1 Tax=Channa argus TaxID=215402 RepID=A0A6G1PS62_CHAAH|nr:Olfactory receptor 10G4 Olfactory receptor OR11-278 [Channa argus]